jgi:nucleoside phosphorylase
MERVTRAVETRRAAAWAPILILSVIMRPEYRGLTDMLPKVGCTRLPETPADKVLQVERWSFKGELETPLEVATAYINGMGNARSAMETLFFLQRIDPTYVFLCGIAGSLDPESVDLGDVVIARSVRWWNLNKVTKDSTKPKRDGLAKYLKIGDHYFRKQFSTVGEHSNHWDRRLVGFVDNSQGLLFSNTDSTLLKLKSKLRGGKDRRSELYYDNIVSWEYVLSDQDIREQIRTDSEGGLVIEMEGAGFCSSIKRQNEEIETLQKLNRTELRIRAEPFVFRGVTDLCHDKGSEDQRWRTIAMANATNALVQFLGTKSVVGPVGRIFVHEQQSLINFHQPAHQGAVQCAEWGCDHASSTRRPLRRPQSDERPATLDRVRTV